MKKYNQLVICLGLLVFKSSVTWALPDNLSSHLQRLESEYKLYTSQQPADSFQSIDPSLKIINHRYTVIDITVHNITQMHTVQNRLVQLGLTHISVDKKQISGLFPINRLSELSTISTISWVRSSQATRRIGPPGGAAFNAADPAMFTDVVRKRFNIDGSSKTIGVLSDSYNCFNGEQMDIASGDLPDNVVLLKEYPFCEDLTVADEGRAMMQLIHDVAPGAKLIFYTAFVSASDFALGIRKLAEAGADIIVDDVGYLDMPMFQEGPIAQAVNEVKNKGVSYFSAAGNGARLSYEQTYTAGRDNISFDQAHDFGVAAGTSSDFYQPITIPKDSQAIITLQWDDPAEIAGGPGALTDLDFFLLDQSKSQIITSSQDSNIDHNPVERLSFINTSEITTYNLYISHRAGPAPSYIKYIFNGPIAPWPEASQEVMELGINLDGASPVIVNKDGTPLTGGKAVIVHPNPFASDINTIGGSSNNTDILIDAQGQPIVLIAGSSIEIGPGKRPIWFVPEGFIAIVADLGEFTIELFRADAKFIPASINRYATYSSTIFGHPNASGAMAVGAIPYKQTPWFGTAIDKGRIEFFSSAGGTPIFFKPDGTRLAEKEVRLKPEIVAPDDVDTTFFPFADESDTDSNGFPNFQGTSAAAPHAAALAALILDAYPFLSPDYVYLAMTRGSLDLNDPSSFTEPAPNNPDCAENTQFDFGTGCGLVQADRVFDVIIEAIKSVFVSARTSATEVTSGIEFKYFFDVTNAGDITIKNVRLHGIVLPERVTYKQIYGCLSIDINEVSCSIPDLAPNDTWTVTIPVMTSKNPPKQLRFEVDLLTDSKVDLSQTHRSLANNVLLFEGDFNSDGCVDQTDWGILFGVFRSGGTSSEYDLTNDGQVTLADLTALEGLYTIIGGASCF